MLDALTSFLRSKSALLVLDNCEHIIAEVARVTEHLLRNCAELRVLATSREPLRIAGERGYRLPSLDVTRDAVTLFTDRARAVDHRFVLSAETAPHVAEICRRLDGIPLAIELAAARVPTIPVRSLVERLDQQMSALSGGARSTQPRQQTMRAAVAWSYDLLPDAERRLFERVAVFVGGGTLEAIAAACVRVGGDDDDLLEVISSLVDKSLLVVDRELSEPRYRLLGPFRQFALEKLALRGELEGAARRHATAYLAQALQVDAAYESAAGNDLFAAIDADIPNWRAALDWTVGTRSDIVLGLRLVAGLQRVWDRMPSEARRWVPLAQSLVDGGTPLDVIARLESAEASVTLWAGEHSRGVAAAARALDLFARLRAERRA